MNSIIEITHSNYKDLEWNEHAAYGYRGLKVSCDHEYDAGVYVVWLGLPSGPNYKFNTNENGDLPYCHEYFAGYMEGKDSGPFFDDALESLMEYVDEYYEYLEPFINKKNTTTIESFVENESADTLESVVEKKNEPFRCQLTYPVGSNFFEIKEINTLVDYIKLNSNVELITTKTENYIINKPKNLFNMISKLYDTMLYKDEYVFYPIFTSMNEIVLPICKYCVSDESYEEHRSPHKAEVEPERYIFVELEFEKFIKLDIITGDVIGTCLGKCGKKYVLEDSKVAVQHFFADFSRIRNEIIKDSNDENISKYNNELMKLLNNNELIKDLFSEKLWSRDLNNSIIEWEPENGINLIDDEILGLALNLVKRFSKFFTYRFSRDDIVEIKTGVHLCDLCENKKAEEYQKLFKDFEKQKLWLNLKEMKFKNSVNAPIGECNGSFISKCPLLVATYLKYLKNVNKLDIKLKEREEYLEKNKDN